MGLSPRIDWGPRDSVVRTTLEDLIAYGDLVEAPIDDEQSGASRRLLFLAQPSYVPLARSTFLLVGVRSEGLPLGDRSLDDQVDYCNHARRITLAHAEKPDNVLRGLGLRELSVEQWLRHPPRTAQQILSSSMRSGSRQAAPQAQWKVSGFSTSRRW